MVEKTKHGAKKQKFDNLVWILIGTKNGSQFFFLLLLKKLTVLDMLERNYVTSLLMGMSSTYYDYLLPWFVDSHYS